MQAGGNRMKRTPYISIVPLILIGTILFGCSSGQVKYIKNNPNFLKPGLWARAFVEAWGPPDEVTAYQDFRNKQYLSFGAIGGSSDRFSGFSSGSSYTPTTVVWIYRKQNKALFFEQGDWLNIPRHALSTLVWKLVGWQNLTPNQTTSPQVTATQEPTTSIPVTPPIIGEKIVTVSWTFANIRSGAGGDHPVVATVKQGDKLTVIGESGEWFNVLLESGQQGWISNGVVEY
jgi:hypothetical protein